MIKAITAENACAIGPNTPRYAATDSADAMPVAPTPTGLMSYRYARLNSMPGGDSPSGLLTTRSATTAIIHAIAMLEYSPSTLPMAWNTSSSISSSAITVLNAIHTTRPGWLCATREKKFDQASDPA